MILRSRIKEPNSTALFTALSNSRQATNENKTTTIKKPWKTKKQTTYRIAVIESFPWQNQKNKKKSKIKNQKIRATHMLKQWNVYNSSRFSNRKNNHSTLPQVCSCGQQPNQNTNISIFAVQVDIFRSVVWRGKTFWKVKKSEKCCLFYRKRRNICK